MNRFLPLSHVMTFFTPMRNEREYCDVFFLFIFLKSYVQKVVFSSQGRR